MNQRERVALPVRSASRVRQGYLLSLILLLAVALRIWAIDAQGIWGDEAFSIYTAGQPLSYVVSGGADLHPPLYHVLLHFWMDIAGRSPLAVRFVSAWWSLLVVAAGFKIVSLSLSKDHSPLPLLAAFLLAISPFQVYYAQETRMYMQAAALCALSLLFFMRLHVGERRALIPWFVSTLLAIYSHYFAFFILAAQDLYLLYAAWRARRAESSIRQSALTELRTAVTAQALMALLYVPWLIVQSGYLSSRANARAGTLSLQGIGDVIGQSLGALFIGAAVDGAAQIAFALLCLGLAALGFFAARKTSFALLFLLCVVVPITGAIAVNPLLPYFRERFLLISSPAFIILMAYGINAIGATSGTRPLAVPAPSGDLPPARPLAGRAEREQEVRTLFASGSPLGSGVSPASPAGPKGEREPPGRRFTRPVYLLSIVSLALISAFVLGNYRFDPRYQKGEYDQAIAAIRAEAQPGDAVLIYSPIQDALYDYYRIERLSAYALPKADLEAVRAKHPRAWLLLYGDPAVYDPAHAAEAYLSAHGFKSFYRSYRDGALVRYDFAPGDGAVGGVRITFGDAIVLTGFSLPPGAARGSTVPVILQWQASRPPTENYTVFVHLLGADGKVAAQMDTQPAGGTRPTKTWLPGETVRDNIGVALPATVPPGAYRVEVGMYDLLTLRRLPVGEAGGLPVQGDAVVIGEVEIR